MNLNALVMCRNTGYMKVLVAAFAELGIEYQISFSADETLDILAQSRHSALVLDFDLPYAAQVARGARNLPSGQRPVMFGMIGASTPISDLFEAGGNFALYKPMDMLQVLHSFRAAEGFMQEDRRKSSRHRGETIAYLELASGTIPALVQNLNEQGLSLQAAEPLPPVRALKLRFVLPGTIQVIQATGDCVWTDRGGRAGVLFTSLPAACTRDLRAWLKKRDRKKSQSTGSMVEVRPIVRTMTAGH